MDVALLASAPGCELGRPGQGPPCPCAELSGPLRRLFGLPIPLNRAAARDLEALPGIGAVRAGAIVAERQRTGPFARVAELVRVSGLGEASVRRLRTELFVGPLDPACTGPVGVGEDPG